MRSPYPGGGPRHPLDMGGIRPPADYLSRLMQQQAAGMPTAQQMAGQDALHRQLLYERERGLLGAAQAQQVHEQKQGKGGTLARHRLDLLTPGGCSSSRGRWANGGESASATVTNGGVS